MKNKASDLYPIICDVVVQIARLGLNGRSQDVQAYVRQSIRRLESKSPDLTERLSELLATAPSTLSPLREVGASIVPVDADSRLALARSEYPVMLSSPPILSLGVRARIEQVVAEQHELPALESQGLGPTRSLLFVGPPGVGKTMTARWIASLMDRPLITLDLATVMSSYLGKTGTNIRSVLDYAKSVPSVLLLDEFDSVAKKRDDEGDIGELKRLVTVLLQEVDDWPSTSLLIAATNHGELLDPAVWRRFDDILEFDIPTAEHRADVLRSAFDRDAVDVDTWIPLLVELWAGQSFSDLTRTVQWLRRRSTITKSPLIEVLLDRVGNDLREGPSESRKEAALLLGDSGFSDRAISEIVGISRDTIRKTKSQVLTRARGGRKVG